MCNGSIFVSLLRVKKKEEEDEEEKKKKKKNHNNDNSNNTICNDRIMIIAIMPSVMTE